MKTEKDRVELSAYGYLLTVKYWLQGDSWKFARQYAYSIVNAFKKPNK